MNLDSIAFHDPQAIEIVYNFTVCYLFEIHSSWSKWIVLAIPTAILVSHTSFSVYS